MYNIDPLTFAEVMIKFKTSVSRCYWDTMITFRNKTKMFYLTCDCSL